MTLRASVTNGEPDAPPLTGSVQFAEEGGTPIGDPVFLDDTGHAELVAAAGAGDYVVKARYSGDSLHDPSTGQASQRVTQAATTTEIASSAAPATAGTPFVIGVAVSAEPPSEGVPTGEVRFSIDGAALGPRVPLDADGQVFIRVTASTAGSAVIGAHYAGDSDYVASEARLTQTVTGGPAAARPQHRQPRAPRRIPPRTGWYRSPGPISLPHCASQASSGPVCMVIFASAPSHRRACARSRSSS
jgi:hypothetical protein